MGLAQTCQRMGRAQGTRSSQSERLWEYTANLRFEQRFATELHGPGAA